MNAMKDSQTGATREPNPFLIFDGGAQLPVQFRDTASIYSKGAVSLGNLAALNISGSCQYSEAQLENLVKKIGVDKFTVYLVDLRQESHVFLNGIPVSWYAVNDWANVGRSLEWIQNDENLHLIRIVAARSIVVSTLVKGESGQFSTKDPVTVEAQDATTEMGLAHQLGIDYIMIPVSDHCRPTDDMVDRFVTFVRRLEANAWLHFHCHGGDGRTTTFMTLYDIIRNAGSLTLEDIAARQSLIGEYDLFKGSSEAYKLRTKFITAFYAYVKDGGYASMSWSEWVQTHQGAVG
jgi:protein-tyrosine phosphatase